MFSFNTVQCVGVLNIFVILCQISYTESYVKINNVFSDGTVETQILNSVDPFALDVSDVWEEQVKFVAKNTLDEKEEENDNERDVFGNWIVESWNNNREVRQINQPSNEKRVPRQSNTGYSTLYPTLPTIGSYGHYGSYNFNNVNNSNRQLPSNGGSNPYQYNTPYPTHNGMNFSYPQHANNFNPGPTNGTYRPTTNYNNSGNPYFPQPASRPFYPGATNNRTNFAYQQTTSRPFYPGATNFGTNFTYPQSPNRPFSQPTTNHTFPGQPIGTSFRPGAVNNTKYPSYPTPTSRPFYPGATNNGTIPSFPQTGSRPSYPGTTTNSTNPSFPQTGSRPSYPGSYFNGTNPSYYPQQTNRPLYPGPTNKTMQHTPSPRPVNHHNSMPPFNNAYNNSRLPANNLPGSSPYNPQTGYPIYNTNGSSQGTIVPGSQRPFYNGSGPYNSGVHGSQVYGQSYPLNPQPHNTTSPTNNFNWNYPQPKPYNHTNGYSTTPNSQYFGNVPQSSYPGKPNSPPNQYNAGSQQNNFFYPAPNSPPSYDPRKNPPNQFSYNH